MKSRTKEMKRVSKESHMADSGANTIKTRAVLAIVEAVLTIYFLLNLSLAELDAGFLVLLFLTFLSYLLSRKMKDVITGVKFSAHVEALPVYAALVQYGLKGAVIINFASYLASLLVRRRKRIQATESHESMFVFLLVAYLTGIPASVIPENSAVQIIIDVISITAGLLTILAVESYFESAKSSTRFGSHFAHAFWIGYPLRISLFLLLVFLSVVESQSTATSLALVAFCYLMYLIVGAVFRIALENNRNKYAVSFELLSSLRAKNESEEKLRLLMLDYARRMAHEANLDGRDFDRTGIAAMLHDFGKAGIDIYSFDSILEDLRANKGDPLHAERAAVALTKVRELKDVAEILRYHHRFHDRESLLRSRKHFRIQASILSVAESFAELLIANEDPIYDERSAFKDLKKGSGWDFDPKALRLLKKVLMRKGIKRV